MDSQTGNVHVQSDPKVTVQPESTADLVTSSSPFQPEQHMWILVLELKFEQDVCQGMKSVTWSQSQSQSQRVCDF